MISIGAYRRGANKLVDAAIDMQDDLNGFLRQRVDHRASIDDARQGLLALCQKVQQRASADNGGKKRRRNMDLRVRPRRTGRTRRSVLRSRGKQEQDKE